MATGHEDEEAREDLWRLEFLLRSTADHSLLVDAEHVWSDDGTLGRWLQRPREVLLAELARAQRVYPGIEPGLRQAQPDGLWFDTEAAFGFLTTSASALDEAGFEVLLPDWWGRRRRVGLRLTTTPKDAAITASGLNRDQLSDFRWDLAVGAVSYTHLDVYKRQRDARRLSRRPPPGRPRMALGAPLSLIHI